MQNALPNPFRALAPNPILSSGRLAPYQPPHNPSPIPLDPNSPSLLLAMASALGASPLPATPHPPPYAHTDGGSVPEKSSSSHGGGCSCGEDEGGPPPVFASSLCPCCCSSSLPPCVAAQQQWGPRGRWGRAETRGRSSPTLLHLSFLHARGLEEQVARETATASGGVAQGCPPPGLCPVSRSPSVPVFFFFSLGPICSHVWGFETWPP